MSISMKDKVDLYHRPKYAPFVQVIKAAFWALAAVACIKKSMEKLR